MKPVVVVTGACGGVGSATCDLLAAEGWEVVGIDRRLTDGPGALGVDLSDAEGVEAALRQLDRVDALVNNAAVQHFKPILETSVEEWDHVAAVNLRGPFLCTKLLAPLLTERRGSVVNVASVHALATSNAIAAYAASKGGLLAFTRAAALELAPGVRVNAVVPGAVDTPALHDHFAHSGGDAQDRLTASTPQKRIGAPQDIARAISFLIDRERSGYMTGQSLVVDGGVLARLASE